MRIVALPIDNVDTDQIIPARFLTVTDKDRLDEALFADWRTDPDFVLNRAHGEMLLAGANFGCGSSREHAVWALQSFGFRAVISTGFADIFRNNALGNGLLPIELSPDAHARVLRICTAQSAADFTVDVAAQTLTLPDGTCFTFPLDTFAKHCLLNGTDALGYLLDAASDIAAYEATHAG